MAEMQLRHAIGYKSCGNSVDGCSTIALNATWDSGWPPGTSMIRMVDRPVQFTNPVKVYMQAPQLHSFSYKSCDGTVDGCNTIAFNATYGPLVAHMIRPAARPVRFINLARVYMQAPQFPSSVTCFVASLLKCLQCKLG